MCNFTPRYIKNVCYKCRKVRTFGFRCKTRMLRSLFVVEIHVKCFVRYNMFKFSNVLLVVMYIMLTGYIRNSLLNQGWKVNLTVELEGLFLTLKIAVQGQTLNSCFWSCQPHLMAFLTENEMTTEQSYPLRKATRCNWKLQKHWVRGDEKSFVKVKVTGFWYKITAQ